MPVVEIASWPASDAYLADPKVLLPGIEYLKKVDGCIRYLRRLTGMIHSFIYLGRYLQFFFRSC